MNQLLSLQSSLLKKNNNNFFAPTSSFWELLHAVVCDTLPPAISGAQEPGLPTRVHLIAPVQGERAGTCSKAGGSFFWTDMAASETMPWKPTAAGGSLLEKKAKPEESHLRHGNRQSPDDINKPLQAAISETGQDSWTSEEMHQ